MKSKMLIVQMLIILGNFSTFSQTTGQKKERFTSLPHLRQETYFDVVKNIVNDNVLYRAASISTLNIRDYHLQAGFLLSYPNQNRVSFKGYFVKLTGDFRIKKVPFESALFYRSNHFSRLIHETNWGFTLGYTSRHFSIKLGNSYRIYKFTSDAIPENKKKNDQDFRIVEPINIMYSFTYSVMPPDNNWNLSLTVTNFDHFLAQQETNPMISCNFSYQLNSRLRLYTELWYQSAGLTNLQVNYFGFYVRTGIIWKIKGS